MPNQQATRKLSRLLNGYDNRILDRSFSFERFKTESMLLIEQGADLYVKNDSRYTLLRILVVENKNNINKLEILRLLEMEPGLVAENGFLGRTILESLLGHFYSDTNPLSLQDFKQTAMLLAETPGFDFSILLHVLAVYNEEGVNDAEIARLLSIKQELIHVKDKEGYTPLHYLVRFSRTKVSIDEIKKWVIFGSDLFTTNMKEESLLHTACQTQNFELMSYLVSVGLDAQAKTNSGRTMLHCAASRQDPATCECLQGFDININAQDELGLTAVHLAVDSDNIAMLHWFSAHKVELNSSDTLRNSVLEYAMKKKKFDLARVLLNKDNQLILAIEQMKRYGEMLKKQPNDYFKGKDATKLADELMLITIDFFKADQPDFATFPKDEFIELLNSKNDVMSEYRINWDTVIKNILIAMTGIGLICIVGQLIYSQIAVGRPLFFFQKDKTTREENVMAVQEAFNQVEQSYAVY